jgi:hypothetical protein
VKEREERPKYVHVEREKVKQEVKVEYNCKSREDGGESGS